MVSEEGRQSGAAAAILRIEQKVLQIDGDELLSILQLIRIRSAQSLMIDPFTQVPAADLLRPTGEIQQAWRVTQRIAPIDLPTADRGQSRRTLGLESRSAIAQLKRLGGVPVAALIIQMGKFVNQCGLQLGIQIGVGSAG